MPLRRTLTRLLARSIVSLGLLATGCAFGSKPAATRAPAPSQSTYSAWEFDTLAQLDQLLDIKGCEGWRLAEAFARGDKIVAIIVYDGTEPPPNDPACHPAA